MFLVSPKAPRHKNESDAQRAKKFAPRAAVRIRPRRKTDTSMLENDEAEQMSNRTTRARPSSIRAVKNPRATRGRRGTAARDLATTSAGRCRHTLPGQGLGGTGTSPTESPKAPHSRSHRPATLDVPEKPLARSPARETACSRTHLRVSRRDRARCPSSSRPTGRTNPPGAGPPPPDCSSPKHANGNPREPVFVPGGRGAARARGAGLMSESLFSFSCLMMVQGN